MRDANIQARMIRGRSGALRYIFMIATPPSGETRGESSKTFVIILEGELDNTTIPTVRKIIAPIFREGAKQLILDLSKVSEIDTSGVASLVDWLQQSRESGIRMTLAGLSPVVDALLDLDHVKGIFEVVPPVQFTLKSKRECSVSCRG